MNTLVAPPNLSHKTRPALIVFGCTFLAVVAMVSAYAFNLPRVYYSHAMFQMIEDSQGDDSSLSRQLQAIRSRDTLFPVIDNLNLTTGWGWGFQKDGTAPSRDEVYTRLLDAIEITPVPASNIIHIGVYARERYDAGNIANMLMVVYHKQLREKHSAPSVPLIKTLRIAKEADVSFRRMDHIMNLIAWGAAAGLFLGIIAAAIPLCWNPRKD